MGERQVQEPHRWVAPDQWSRAGLGATSDGLGAIETRAAWLARRTDSPFTANIPLATSRTASFFKDEVNRWDHILRDPKGWWDQASGLDKAGVAATFAPFGVLGKGLVKGAKEALGLRKHVDDVKKAPASPKLPDSGDTDPGSGRSGSDGGPRKSDPDASKGQGSDGPVPESGSGGPDGGRPDQDGGGDRAGSTADEGSSARDGDDTSSDRQGGASDGPDAEGGKGSSQQDRADSPHRGEDSEQGRSGGDSDSPSREGKEAARDGTHVNLDELPPWHSVDPVPTSGVEARIYDPDFDRWAGKGQQQFYDEWYDAEAGTWKYPSKENGAKYDDGFAEPPRPNTLKVGDTIDRLGGARGGNFAAPDGTPFGERALPPSDVAREYHQYRLLKPLPDSVTEGKIQGWFDQPGGGIQYKFDKDIKWYIDNDYLAEV